MFDTVHVYIDNIISITKEYFADHLKALERILHKLAEAGWKVNAENSFFGRTETKYLVLCFIKNVVRTLSSKVYYIKAINYPTKVCYVRWFVGIINCYRYMWSKNAYTISNLTKLCYPKVKFNWTDIRYKAFTEMEKIVGRDVLLSYPNFSEDFIINTDYSKTHIGA